MDDGPLKCDAGAWAILSRLRAAGHEAYLVGGCVRDHLMGKAPKDWDIATDAAPSAIEQLFDHTVAVGKAFGVIIVVWGGRSYEVATFRDDGDYSDGRRPDSVRFSTAEADVRRRDFTINALLYDPFAEQVLDFVDGQRDLAAGLLRTVGDPGERFREDRLRLLRAVRFAARTGFRLEAATLAAMCDLASLVTTVSAERVGEELKRMLSEGYAAAAMQMLQDATLLRHVLPEVAQLGGVPQPPQFHPEGDVLVHTLLMLPLLDATIRRGVAAENDRPADAQEGGPAAPYVALAGGEPLLVFPAERDRVVLAWAVLLHDVGKPETISFADRIRFHCHDAASVRIARTVLKRLRYPNVVIDAVAELVARHMKFCHVRNMREAKRRRFLQDPAFLLHLELHRLDCLSSHGRLDNFEFALAAWQDEQQRPAELEPLLTGHDLIEMGYAPGPCMGRILAALADARLEGTVQDETDARQWVRDSFPP